MVKISGLPPDASPTTDDYVPGVDAGGTLITKRWTWANLITLFFANIPAASITAAARTQVVKNGSITGATLNTTGNKSVTGVGFTPKMVSFYCLYSGASVYIGSGRMFADGTQHTQWSGIRAIATNNVVTFNNNLTTRCYGESSITAGGAESPTVQLSFVSMDADGFTINVNSTNAATNGVYWIAEA